MKLDMRFGWLYASGDFFVTKCLVAGVCKIIVYMAVQLGRCVLEHVGIFILAV